MRNPFRRPPAEPPLTPLEQARIDFHARLVPATVENVTAALAPTRPDPEDMRARELAEREAREQRELERLRTTRIRYEIDLTAEQWLLLSKHGYDPTLPANGTRNRGPGVVHAQLIGRVEDPAALYAGATKPVYEPLRNGVCELEGVEIDGHEASDLDPFGGCMHCGKQEICGLDDFGRPIRYDNFGDRDEWDRTDT